MTIEKSAKIAFVALTQQAHSDWTYTDARYGTYMAAIDCFGACSEIPNQVLSTWELVGVEAGINEHLEVCVNEILGPTFICFDSLADGDDLYVYTCNNPGTVTWTTPSHWQRIISGNTVTLYGTTLSDPSLPFYDQITASYQGATVSLTIVVEDCEDYPGIPDSLWHASPSPGPSLPQSFDSINTVMNQVQRSDGITHQSDPSDALNVRIFNNPSNDGLFILTIYSENRTGEEDLSIHSEHFNLDVYDCLGSRMFSTVFSEPVQEFEPSLVPGFYFVHVYDTKAPSRSRIIKLLVLGD